MSNSTTGSSRNSEGRTFGGRFDGGEHILAELKQDELQEGAANELLAAWEALAELEQDELSPSELLAELKQDELRSSSRGLLRGLGGSGGKVASEQ